MIHSKTFLSFYIIPSNFCLKGDIGFLLYALNRDVLLVSFIGLS